MDQFDLFGEVHQTSKKSTPPPQCAAGPDVALAVLTAVHREHVQVDRTAQRSQFDEAHEQALAHLLASGFIRPGTGQQRGDFVLTDLGHTTYLRWTALASLPGEEVPEDD